MTENKMERVGDLILEHSNLVGSLKTIEVLKRMIKEGFVIDDDCLTAIYDGMVIEAIRLDALIKAEKES